MPNDPPSTTGLTGLRAMSTTAGLGQDYRSINPVAIVSAVLVLIGLAAIVHPVLLLAPILGGLLGILAAIQIVRSNGTQVGLPLVGIALAGAVGIGLTLGRGAMAQYSADRAAVAQSEEVLTDFGDAVVAGDYDAAYELTSPYFRDIVPKPFFERFVESLESQELPFDQGLLLGELAGSRIGPHLSLAEDGIGPHTTAELIFDGRSGRESRQPVRLRLTDDGWRIEEMHGWFDRTKR
jgi:hypothetical protein